MPMRGCYDLHGRRFDGACWSALEIVYLLAGSELGDENCFYENRPEDSYFYLITPTGDTEYVEYDTWVFLTDDEIGYVVM